MNKADLLEIIYEWKNRWMNQHQNSEEDYQNYHRRAFGVDANMIHSLATMIEKRVSEHTEKLERKIARLEMEQWGEG